MIVRKIKKSKIALFLVLLLPLGSNLKSQTLTEQLREKAEASQAKGSSDRRAIMESALEDLRNSKIIETAVSKGAQIPHFKLPDGRGKMVSSQKLLKKGPLVITFYRGGWCPYCNLQLHDLQKYLPNIQALGAELVAISPETPDNSMTTAEKNKLEFYVLSDAGNKVAHQFGLSYKLPPDLIELYQEFGIDLTKSNGTTDGELPIAATYVVNKEGEIIYSFLDIDYKKRAETTEIIEVLESL